MTSPVSQTQVSEPRPPGSALSNGASSNGANTNGAATNGASTPARLGYIPALDGAEPGGRGSLTWVCDTGEVTTPPSGLGARQTMR